MDLLYAAYVPAVSDANMAISLPMANYLAELAARDDVHTILDLGSGLSSAVLRASGKQVTTVDTSALWLERTRQFLRAHDLSTERMYDFAGNFPREHFDLVFHDLGDMRQRAASLDYAVAACNRILVLDDMHSVDYLAKVCDTLGEKDEFGRFGLSFFINK